MKNYLNYKLFLFWAVLIWAVFLFPKTCQATDYRLPEIKIYSSDNLQLKNNFLVFDKDFKGGASVAIGDLGGDGINELIVGPGPGGGPHIKIFRSDGSLIASFFAYSDGYRKGINLAVGDLDGNGTDEIITSTRYGGTPHVRIFDGYGRPKFTWGFFAFQEDFQGGVNLTTCDINGNGKKEIIAAAGPSGNPHARVFNEEGKYLGVDFFPFSDDEKGGVTVACANVDGGKEEEIVFGIQTGGEPWVKVYKIHGSEQIVLGQFLVFSKNFQGGVNVAGGDIDQDGYDEVVVAANTGGGPHIRSFEAYGRLVAKSFFAFEDEFRGGTLITIGDTNNDSLDEIVVSPARRPTEGRTDLAKYIEIDISNQELAYYDHGYLMKKFKVSTGKWSMPTPLGTFAIRGKMPRAYSRKYNLYMPYWMEFHPGYGIHELPEWSNGYKEGANHLGIRVSHGCVRLGIGPAEELYNWADVGTVVIVKN